LTYFNLRGGPPGRRTNRPTWPVSGCQAVQSTLGVMVMVRFSVMLVSGYVPRLLRVWIESCIFCAVLSPFGGRGLFAGQHDSIVIDRSS